MIVYLHRYIIDFLNYDIGPLNLYSWEKCVKDSHSTCGNVNFFYISSSLCIMYYMVWGINYIIAPTSLQIVLFINIKYFPLSYSFWLKLFYFALILSSWIPISEYSYFFSYSLVTLLCPCFLLEAYLTILCVYFVLWPNLSLIREELPIHIYSNDWYVIFSLVILYFGLVCLIVLFFLRIFISFDILII